MLHETNPSYAWLNNVLNNMLTMTLETVKIKSDKNTALASSQSAENTVKTIREVAENIRQYSVIIKETTKAVRKSGAIPELAGVILEVASAVRDTAKEIRETTKDLKESGAIHNTARAVGEARKETQHTIDTFRDTAENIRQQMKKFDTP